MLRYYTHQYPNTLLSPSMHKIFLSFEIINIYYSQE